MVHFYPKLLLISGHKDLIFNSQVSYINIFKTSVPDILGIEYFQIQGLSVKLYQDIEKFYLFRIDSRNSFQFSNL